MSPDPADLTRLHGLAFLHPRPWSEAEFRALLARADTLTITAPEGFAMGRVTLDEAELLTIAVAPDARRGGLGGRLLGRFLEGARIRGATTVFLEVDSLNTAARALYAAAGFTQVGLRRNYYRDGPVMSDALVLRRSLP